MEMWINYVSHETCWQHSSECRSLPWFRVNRMPCIRNRKTISGLMHSFIHSLHSILSMIENACLRRNINRLQELDGHSSRSLFTWLITCFYGAVQCEYFYRAYRAPRVIYFQFSVRREISLRSSPRTAPRTQGDIINFLLNSKEMCRLLSRTDENKMRPFPPAKHLSSSFEAIVMYVRCDFFILLFISLAQTNCHFLFN